MTKQTRTEECSSVSNLIMECENVLGHGLRTSSLIVTVFGDAIVPRGGSVWLGTLTDILSVFGITAGNARTAMSRLTADCWVERTRQGRQSFYRLTGDAQKEFKEASQTIYQMNESPWNGDWQIAVLMDQPVAAKPALRNELIKKGFGQLAPDVFIAVGRILPDDQSQEGIVLLSGACSQHIRNARSLVQIAWPLEKLSESYGHFIDVLMRLEQFIDKQNSISTLDALALRIFIIHELRRIVLRDPHLPTKLLPDNWPGQKARITAAKLWKGLVAPSEAWLEQHGRCSLGNMPPADKSFSRRFAGKT